MKHMNTNTETTTQQIEVRDLKVGDLIKTGKHTAYRIEKITKFKKYFEWSMDRYCYEYTTAKRHNMISQDGNEIVEVIR